jgi:penicillin amidase
MPGVIIGHNDRIAWGLTNLGPDVMDLYVERVNPDNPLQYEVDGEWVDMEVRTETISVAGGDDVELTVRLTRHGPIISDDYGPLEDFTDNAGIPLPDAYAIALRWTALDENPSLVDATLALDLATDFSSFRDALRLFDVPAQNMIYADVDGNIGYQAPGKIPIRENWDGGMPVPGWSDEYEWSGFIPFDELPSVYNPSEGFIVTANNPVVDDSYLYPITTDWNYGDRAFRIREMIEADSSVTLDDVAAMQFDDYNRHAERILPWLLALDLAKEDGTVVRAQEILANWDRHSMTISKRISGQREVPAGRWRWTGCSTSGISGCGTTRAPHQSKTATTCCGRHSWPVSPRLRIYSEATPTSGSGGGSMAPCSATRRSASRASGLSRGASTAGPIR